MKHPKKEKPMSKRALKALKKSIQKWEDILAGTGTDAGNTNCDLCRLYNQKYPCVSCPGVNTTKMNIQTQT